MATTVARMTLKTATTFNTVSMALFLLVLQACGSDSDPQAATSASTGSSSSQSSIAGLPPDALLATIELGPSSMGLRRPSDGAVVGELVEFPYPALGYEYSNHDISLVQSKQKGTVVLYTDSCYPEGGDFPTGGKQLCAIKLSVSGEVLAVTLFPRYSNGDGTQTSTKPILSPDGQHYLRAATAMAESPEDVHSPKGAPIRLEIIDLDGNVVSTFPETKHAHYLDNRGGRFTYDWLPDGSIVLSRHDFGIGTESGHYELGDEEPISYNPSEQTLTITPPYNLEDTANFKTVELGSSIPNGTIAHLACAPTHQRCAIRVVNSDLDEETFSAIHLVLDIDESKLVEPVRFALSSNKTYLEDPSYLTDLSGYGNMGEFQWSPDGEFFTFTVYGESAVSAPGGFYGVDRKYRYIGHYSLDAEPYLVTNPMSDPVPTLLHHVPYRRPVNGYDTVSDGDVAESTAWVSTGY